MEFVVKTVVKDTDVYTDVTKVRDWAAKNGWEIVDFRYPAVGEDYLGSSTGTFMRNFTASQVHDNPKFIVKKLPEAPKPRKFLVETTGEFRLPRNGEQHLGEKDSDRIYYSTTNYENYTSTYKQRGTYESNFRQIVKVTEIK